MQRLNDITILWRSDFFRTFFVFLMNFLFYIFALKKLCLYPFKLPS